MPKANTSGIRNKFLDIAYAQQSPAQKLDIYVPNEGSGPFPVIVSIHGGAFKMGDKGDFQANAALSGLKRGYAVVSINYRLSGEAIYPAQIQDVKAAIRWIRANAGTYKLNPAKIAAWGGSAGGNLAALAGTTGDITDFDDAALGNAGQSSRVQAVVDWFGPIQFDQMDAQFTASGKGKPDHGEASSPESALLGKPIMQAPELVKRASPATYISKADPPFFIEHGTNDPLVPTQQSIHFAAALSAVLGSDKVTYTPIEGAGHGGPQFEAPENLEKVFAFLDKHLK
jgi:acetyl esterase/lipase